MALKYWFEFTDVKEITHRVEISKNVEGSGYAQRVLDDGGIVEAISCVNAFLGIVPAVQIYGSCSLEYSETKDTLESVRGSGLKIDLDASSDLTFSDLYSEEERTFSVEYFRDGDTLFNGWLSPEGIYQSLVSDKWVISLDCTDGLGFLKNLSYVEDATGLNFVGKQSLIKIVSNCLKRTKIQSKIYAGIDIYYAGLSDNLSVLENVYYNADRFVKEDSNPSGSDGTIMNCEEVLKSVLEPFGAVITAHKGEWLIYKPNSLVNATVSSFFGYDYNGDALALTTKSFDFRSNLGSQINDFYPHHVNANQQKTIKSAIGAFRINYNYGLVKSFLSNPNLRSDSDTSLPDYNIINQNYFSFRLNANGNREGVRIETVNDIIPVFELSKSINLPINSSFEFFVKYFILSAFTSARFEVKITNTSNTYYLKKLNIISSTLNSRVCDSEWVEEQTYILMENNGRFVENETIITAPTPEAGEVELIIYTSEASQGGSTDPYSLIELNLLNRTDDTSLKGENHTFQRKNKPSSKIKDIKKVFNGDNPSDIYVGTIYKADQTTPTSIWERPFTFSNSDRKPILQLMGEERMKMYGKPLQVYSGDVFGFFNYLNVATISGFTGVFMPTSYSYDCQANVTSVTYVEILDTDILEDVDYQKTFDYGNVVEPTIKF